MYYSSYFFLAPVKYVDTNDSDARDHFEKSDKLRIYRSHIHYADVVVATHTRETGAASLKREMRDLELVSQGRSIGATRIS